MSKKLKFIQHWVQQLHNNDITINHLSNSCFDKLRRQQQRYLEAYLTTMAHLTYFMIPDIIKSQTTTCPIPRNWYDGNLPSHNKT